MLDTLYYPMLLLIRCGGNSRHRSETTRSKVHFTTIVVGGGGGEDMIGIGSDFLLGVDSVNIGSKSCTAVSFQYLANGLLKQMSTYNFRDDIPEECGTVVVCGQEEWWEDS